MQKIIPKILMATFLFALSDLTRSSPSCDSSTQLCGVSVLIEQNSVLDADYPALLNRVPQLEQLHLRVSGPGSDIVLYGKEGPGIVNATVATIQKIRSVNSTVKLGFHPDLSSGSYSSWNCADGDASCLFNNSISVMNLINARLGKNDQLTLYSLEQSYPVPTDAPSIAAQKSCLQGQASAECPTPANPPVQYGYVAPSCMADNLLGPAYYDYAYPQMYGTFGPNNVSPTHAQYNWFYSSQQTVPTIPSSSYPPQGQWPAPLPGGQYGFVLLDSYQITIPPPSHPIYYSEQVIPFVLTQFQDGDIHSIYEADVFSNPEDVALTLSAMVAGKYADKVNDPGFPCGVPLTGNVRYFTLSGEPEFLGSSGWTIPSLNQFLTAFGKSLATNGVSPPAIAGIQYAIWGFDTMNGPGSLLGSTATTPVVLGGSSHRLNLHLTTGNGHGQVASDPPGILCGRRCSHPFQKSHALKLIATPDPGYRFVRWKGACSGARSTCRIRLMKDQTVSAVFARRKSSK